MGSGASLPATSQGPKRKCCRTCTWRRPQSTLGCRSPGEPRLPCIQGCRSAWVATRPDGKTRSTTVNTGSVGSAALKPHNKNSLRAHLQLTITSNVILSIAPAGNVFFFLISALFFFYSAKQNDKAPLENKTMNPGAMGNAAGCRYSVHHIMPLKKWTMMSMMTTTHDMHTLTPSTKHP